MRRRQGGLVAMRLAKGRRLLVHVACAIRLHTVHGSHFRRVHRARIGCHRELAPSQHRDTEDCDQMAYFSCQHVFKLSETGAEVKMRNYINIITAEHEWHWVMCTHNVLCIHFQKFNRALPRRQSICCDAQYTTHRTRRVT